MREDVELIARALAKPVAYSLKRERTNSVLDALESVFDFERLHGAYVYDLEGRLLAQAGRKRAANELLDPLSANLPNDPVGSYERFSGESIFSFFVPLAGPTDEALGVLQVTRSGDEMAATLATLQKQFILGYSLFVGSLILFLHLLYNYSIHRPIGKLHRSIRRIRPGKSHERIPIEGARELQELGTALNRMLAAIESQQTEISQKKRQEASLKRRLRNSEQLAAIGELAGSIGHEIGTPLATIDGYAQRGSRSAESPASHSAFKSIRSEVLQIEHFVRELLSFQQAPPTSQSPLNFAELLVDACEQLPPKYAAKVQIHLDRKEFPDGKVLIRANYARLRLVLKNILLNAFQAHEQASVDCYIRAENKKLVCLVDDDGPGIPPDQREAIFTPFVTGRPGAGTGLGLALADRITQEYDGDLSATESPKAGARIVLRLPLFNPTAVLSQ